MSLYIHFADYAEVGILESTKTSPSSRSNTFQSQPSPNNSLSSKDDYKRKSRSLESTLRSVDSSNNSSVSRNSSFSSRTSRQKVSPPFLNFIKQISFQATIWAWASDFARTSAGAKQVAVKSEGDLRLRRWWRWRINFRRWRIHHNYSYAIKKTYPYRIYCFRRRGRRLAPWTHRIAASSRWSLASNLRGNPRISLNMNIPI